MDKVWALCLKHTTFFLTSSVGVVCFHVVPVSQNAGCLLQQVCMCHVVNPALFLTTFSSVLPTLSTMRPIICLLPPSELRTGHPPHASRCNTVFVANNTQATVKRGVAAVFSGYDCHPDAQERSEGGQAQDTVSVLNLLHCVLLLLSLLSLLFS